ncbi:MAG: adenylate kinase, partial [Bacteroidales bacterium]|nr:adenylate kinase [Bacteroidales bacterium]
AKIQGRADDNEATINNRLQEYNNKTLPVAQYYAAQGKQKVIDGLGTVEDIAARIRTAIG